MTLLRRYRWLGGTFALLLMAWQAAATFGHVHAVPAAVAGEAATGVGHDNNGGDDDHGHHHRGCDACAILHVLSSSFAPDAAIIAHCAVALALHFATSGGIAVAASHRLGFDARGPPRL